MSRTVYYAAVSLDGFIATPDGGVDWLGPFNSPDLGYEPFLAGVGAVVLGRATYEQALTFGPWPYPGRRGLVVTSRRISALPPDVRAITLAELPAALRDLRASVTKDTWIVGGGQTAAACLAAGLVDELELYLVPHLLGDGIPLLAHRSATLTLRETRAFSNGVVMLRYAVARA
jgi:dihydrofolate reductase